MDCMWTSLTLWNTIKYQISVGFLWDFFAISFRALSALLMNICERFKGQNGRIAQGNFCAHVALKSRSRRTQVALTSRSNTPKSGERILGAHTAVGGPFSSQHNNWVSKAMGSVRTDGVLLSHLKKSIAQYIHSNGYLHVLCVVRRLGNFHVLISNFDFFSSIIFVDFVMH